MAEGRLFVHRDRLREDVLAAIAAKYDDWDAGAEIEPFGPRALLEVPTDGLRSRRASASERPPERMLKHIDDEPAALERAAGV